MAAEGAHAVEEEAGLVAEGTEGGRVGGVGGEDGDLGRRVGLSGPFEGLGQLGGVAARYGEGGEMVGIEEFEGFFEDLLAGET